MEMIRNFLSGGITKILSVMIVVLFLIVSGLLSYTFYQNSKLSKYQDDISILQKDNDILDKRIQTLTELNKLSSNASQSLDNKNQTTKTKTEDVLRKIDEMGALANATENKNTSNGNIFNPDIIRMLNEECSAIRGSACSNP